MSDKNKSEKLVHLNFNNSCHVHVWRIAQSQLLSRGRFRPRRKHSQNLQFDGTKIKKFITKHDTLNFTFDINTHHELSELLSINENSSHNHRQLIRLESLYILQIEIKINN